MQYVECAWEHAVQCERQQTWQVRILISNLTLLIGGNCGPVNTYQRHKSAPWGAFKRPIGGAKSRFLPIGAHCGAYLRPLSRLSAPVAGLIGAH
jgi:hypothetical protein